MTVTQSYDGAQEQCGQLNKAMRLKTFDEMDDVQKIAYLHNEVKGLIQQNRWLQQRVSSLEGHQHGARGEVLVLLGYANQAVGGLTGGY